MTAIGLRTATQFMRHSLNALCLFWSANSRHRVCIIIFMDDIRHYLKQPKSLFFFTALMIGFSLFFNNAFSNREKACENKCEIKGLDYKYTPHRLDVLDDYVNDKC